MKNRHGIEPTRFLKKKYNNRAIYCYVDRGPVFGSGHDIWIGNNCNRDKGGWTNFGNSESSYKCNSPLKSSLFVNTAGPDQWNYFKVSDYEVFTYN